ncbi:MAG: suppressor of fused domain protein [Lentisphaeraceae bacterium]|nr:suppressor of fused domain protein [Lentisphaeraceae bacterium]
MKIDDQLRFIYFEYLQRYGKPSGYFTYKPESDTEVLPREILVLYWQDFEDTVTHFATLGMSTQKMENGEAAELRLTLRGTFEGDDILALSRFLANFTMYPFLHDFAVDWWNIIVDVGQIPVYPDSNALFVHPEPSDFNTDHISMGDQTIKLFNIVPLTSQESNIVQTEGVVHLLDYLEENEIDMLQVR